MMWTHAARVPSRASQKSKRQTADGREREELNGKRPQLEARIHRDGKHAERDGDSGKEARRARAEQRHREEARQDQRAGDVAT